MSISETKYFCGAGIFVVDSGENRGIIVQTSKAATKTGAQASRPRERPLVLQGSCRERTAPPLPSRPPEQNLSYHGMQGRAPVPFMGIARPRTSAACPNRPFSAQAQYGGTGPPVTASKSGGLCPQAGWNRG